MKARGLDFTVEELTKLANDAILAESGSGELSEESLDNVSGGSLLLLTVGTATIVCGAVCKYWCWRKSYNK